MLQVCQGPEGWRPSRRKTPLILALTIVLFAVVGGWAWSEGDTVNRPANVGLVCGILGLIGVVAFYVSAPISFGGLRHHPRLGGRRRSREQGKGWQAHAALVLGAVCVCRRRRHSDSGVADRRMGRRADQRILMITRLSLWRPTPVEVVAALTLPTSSTGPCRRPAAAARVDSARRRRRVRGRNPPTCVFILPMCWRGPHVGRPRPCAEWLRPPRRPALRAPAHRGGLNGSAQHFLIRLGRGGCDGPW